MCVSDEFKQEPMDEFERDLARALRRVEVRSETTAKFLAIAAQARAEHERTGKMWVRPASGGRLLFLPKPRIFLGGVIAAMLLLGLFVGGKVQERRKAEIAARQFEVAMRITGRTLDGVGERVSRAGTRQEKE
jgi:hypothetical protein